MESHGSEQGSIGRGRAQASARITKRRPVHSESRGRRGGGRQAFLRRNPSTSTVPWHRPRRIPAGYCSRIQRNRSLATSHLAKSVLAVAHTIKVQRFFANANEVHDISPPCEIPGQLYQSPRSLLSNAYRIFRQGFTDPRQTETGRKLHLLVGVVAYCTCAVMAKGPALFCPLTRKKGRGILTPVCVGKYLQSGLNTDL